MAINEVARASSISTGAAVAVLDWPHRVEAYAFVVAFLITGFLLMGSILMLMEVYDLENDVISPRDFVFTHTRFISCELGALFAILICCIISLNWTGVLWSLPMNAYQWNSLRSHRAELDVALAALAVPTMKRGCLFRNAYYLSLFCFFVYSLHGHIKSGHL
eukprot:gnl/Spiro4/8832_TR4649_c0_g1_i1.p1 gnl/Spiro4/8832_TR4649_c0_g1~~gnl/Spiro4/8832_TR4649_c0_g1_i1.p1  ORF type:complete len:162 (+),score=11.34 gnl/Spiro4/8832_TR4649_c0_g1_i1:141-626(+)